MESDPRTDTRPIDIGRASGVKRRVLKVLLVLGIVMVVLLVGTGVGVWRYGTSAWHKISNHPEIVVDPIPPGQAYNVLVLGSDRRDVVEGTNLTQYKGGSGQRSDTIMLIHIAADGKRAVALSFPRDLRVQIPGYRGHDKINAAYSYGGPNLIIKTITQLTGLPVNHYVEVNFESFRSIVNAVGGLRMCYAKAVYDRPSKLYIPKPGCYNFNGDQALSFARMRYADPKGDFGRIERQQLLIRTLMNKVTSLGFLVNVKRLVNLISAVSKGVITDKTLSLSEVRGIARRLAGFKQSNVDFRVVPSYGEYIGDVSYVIAKPEAEVVYQYLLKDLPLPAGSEYGKTSQSIPGPADVSVKVLNGTNTTGLAKKVADRLKALGFDIYQVGDNPRHDVKKTQILFAPGLALKAQLVQQQFPGATVTESVGLKGPDVMVIIGADQATPSPSPGG